MHEKMYNESTGCERRYNRHACVFSREGRGCREWMWASWRGGGVCDVKMEGFNFERFFHNKKIKNKNSGQKQTSKPGNFSWKIVAWSHQEQINTKKKTDHAEGRQQAQGPWTNHIYTLSFLNQENFEWKFRRRFQQTKSNPDGKKRRTYRVSSKSKNSLK